MPRASVRKLSVSTLPGGVLAERVVWTLMGKPGEVPDADAPVGSAAASITEAKMAEARAILHAQDAFASMSAVEMSDADFRGLVG
jgi:hypothetical protein